MNIIKRLLRAPEFQVLLFFASIILFIWPIVITDNGTNNKFVIYSLYGSWGIIIFIHMLVHKLTKEE